MAGPAERPQDATPHTPAPGHETELGRLRSDATFHQRFRDLTVAFARGLSSTAAMAAALKTLVRDANALLGASRTSVWLHERRAYELVLAACSDDHPPALAGTVPSDDVASPPAMGLRLDLPTVIPGSEGRLLLAPLRGRRRALGTLVVEGPFTGELEGPRLLDFTHELSRQLSATIENIQLLEEMARQRRLLEDTFDALVDLVVVTDPGLRIVQMNDAFICRVGRTRRELVDRPIGDVLGAEMTAWIRTAADATPFPPGANGASTARFEDPRLAGIFAVTMTALAQEGAPAGHVIVARDITHQTRLEQDRDAMRARLAQSEKLAALGQFVAGIAHEMNNPLQGVLGHIELLLETSPAAQPLRHELRRVLQDADRAVKIVRNLMTFTGGHRLTRRRLRPSRLLSRVVASRAAALARAGIEVTCEEAAGLPPMIGDPLLLHQALLNILINAEHAIEASGGGGRIHVRVSPGADGHVVMAIRDTGPGIPADVLSRIFDPFFTTKEVGQGTGLGLAITYGIVQEHGGTITAANDPGGGAILTIDLPAAGSVKTSGAAGEPRRVPAGRGRQRPRRPPVR